VPGLVRRPAPRLRTRPSFRALTCSRLHEPRATRVRIPRVRAPSLISGRATTRGSPRSPGSCRCSPPARFAEHAHPPPPPAPVAPVRTIRARSSATSRAVRRGATWARVPSGARSRALRARRLSAPAASRVRIAPPPGGISTRIRRYVSGALDPSSMPTRSPLTVWIAPILVWW
jgi:hypothetical protein